MITVGQKVKFDPFQHIGGYGAAELRGKKVTGTAVEVHEDHGWFSVEYGDRKQRTSFLFDDIGKDALLYCGHTCGLAGSVSPDNFCSYGERR